MLTQAIEIHPGESSHLAFQMHAFLDYIKLLRELGTGDRAKPSRVVGSRYVQVPIL